MNFKEFIENNPLFTERYKEPLWILTYLYFEGGDKGLTRQELLTGLQALLPSCCDENTLEKHLSYALHVSHEIEVRQGNVERYVLAPSAKEHLSGLVTLITHYQK